MKHTSRREKLMYRNNIKNEGRRLVIRHMKAQMREEIEMMKKQQEEFERLQAKGKILQGSPIHPNIMPIQGQIPPGAQIQAIPVQITREQLEAITRANNSGIILPN